MAFNFGAETPPPPPLQKVEENGYVVGQENGYSGVRVRIKSLKNVKKDTSPEEKPAADKQEGPLKEAGPTNSKREEPSRIVPLPRVVELRLFDLPPIEVEKEPTEIPVETLEIPAEAPEIAAEMVEAETIIPIPAAAISVVEPESPPAVIPDAIADPIPEIANNGPLPIGSPAPVKNDSPPVKPAKSKRGRKSLKQVAAEADLIEVPGDEILFSKQYYTMRAVAEMFRVNQSLLRFWETEFDILQPRKNKKGDRYFRPVDIKNLHLIYHLLRQRKYTIEGAKEFLKNNKKAEERFEAIQRLQQLKAFLLEWKAQL